MTRSHFESERSHASARSPLRCDPSCLRSHGVVLSGQTHPQSVTNPLHSSYSSTVRSTRKLQRQKRQQNRRLRSSVLCCLVPRCRPWNNKYKCTNTSVKRSRALSALLSEECSNTGKQKSVFVFNCTKGHIGTLWDVGAVAHLYCIVIIVHFKEPDSEDFLLMNVALWTAVHNRLSLHGCNQNYSTNQVLKWKFE